MSHSDPCGRCRQPRRAHIDTVAGLLCPLMRFVPPGPAGTPETLACGFTREGHPPPAAGARWIAHGKMGCYDSLDGAEPAPEPYRCITHNELTPCSGCIASAPDRDRKIEELRTERDRAQEVAARKALARDTAESRALAAEAEAKRLREALSRIVVSRVGTFQATSGEGHERCIQIAAAALKGTDHE